MFIAPRRLAVPLAVMALLPAVALAQNTGFGPAPAAPNLKLPAINGYVTPKAQPPLAAARDGQVTLAAELTDKAPEVTRGIVWRIFRPEPGKDGKLPLVATARGGTSTFQLAPGSYLVHAAFGRAGATKRITVSREPKREVLVLDAGGLELDGVVTGGQRIPSANLRFSIYEAERDADGERPLIVPNVRPDTVVRLNAGTYHVVSNYGTVNAVIRSDIRVEAGKLTEATVEHRAAQITMKLVREHGGEAMADTSWSVLTDAGETIFDNVGAYASLVLAEGDYIIVAKNRGRIYRRAYTVEAGHNAEVEVLANEESEKKVPLGDIAD
jgi:hypothetical protein